MFYLYLGNCEYMGLNLSSDEVGLLCSNILKWRLGGVWGLIIFF